MNQDEIESLKELVSEEMENLSSLENELVILDRQLTEKSDLSEETVNTVFRMFHSIKGSSGFFSLPAVVRTAHEAESLLDIIRRNREKLSRNLIDLLMETKDLLTEVFIQISEKYSDLGFEDRCENLISRLRKEKEELSRENFSEESGTENYGLFEDEGKKEEESFGLFEENNDKIIKKNTSSSVGFSEGMRKKEVSDSPSGKAAADIRIGTEKLDRLLDLIGELVIAESQVTETAAQFDENRSRLNIESWKRSAVHLHKIVRNLQETALSLRMVPLSGIFRRMERFILDLNRKTGKKIELKIFGERTEIDKNMVELIIDPLTHLLRNSADHGIESPEERTAAGKGETGRIILSAEHAGKEVWISIEDDGRGIDREKILQKASEKGILSDSGNSLKDSEVWDFIFLPGFSTAEKLTDISGRGVGMDVVKKNISKMNGSITVDSKKGEGTKILLKIPLTLAIIDGMSAKYAGRYFVIPSISVQETVNLKEVQIRRIDSNFNVMKFREKMIPVIRLENFLKMKSRADQAENKYVVIIESSNLRLGLILDDILGNKSIVIKPISELFSAVPGISGCTILGNGVIGLILDVNYLLDRIYYGEHSAGVRSLTV